MTSVSELHGMMAALYYRPTVLIQNTEYNESFWLETLATWNLLVFDLPCISCSDTVVDLL